MSASIFEPVAAARRHPFGRYVFFTAGVHGLLAGVGFAIGVYTTAGILNGSSAVRLALAVATGLAIGQVWTVRSSIVDDPRVELQAPSHYERLCDQVGAGEIPDRIGTIRALGILAGVGATTWPYTLEGVIFGIGGSVVLILMTGLTLLFGSGVLIGSLLDESELVVGAQTIAAGIAVVGVTWLLP